MESVSVCMLIKNEALRLPAALSSLAGLSGVDEIVVMDTGSTDGSQDIARGHGARVLEEPWRGDFAYHRNRALEACRNDWIFTLDGDEILADVGDLNALLGAADLDGVAIPIETRSPSGAGEHFHFVRAFDRRKGRWAFPIHNQVVGLGPVALSTGRIIAFYEGDETQTQRRRLRILMEALETSPEEPHHLFFAAKTHSILGELEACAALCDRYLSLKATEGLADRATVWVWKVECLLQGGDVAGAEAALAEALRAHPRYPDLRFYAFLLATKAWYESAASLPRAYLQSPLRSVDLARRVPEWVEAMGLPLSFERSPE